MQNNQRLFSNAGFRLRDDLETRVYLTHVDAESELPGNLTKAQLEDDPRQANAASITGDQRRDFTLTWLANKTSWRLNETEQLDVSLFYADKDLFHPIFQVLEVGSEDYGVDARFVSDAALNGHANRLIVGLCALQGENRDERFVNVAGSSGALTNDLDQKATHLQVYVENHYGFTAEITSIAGVHALRATRDSRDKLVVGGVDETADETYSGFSPKLGVRYEPAPGTQIFGNLGRSIEPPSCAELRRPNGELNDEQTATTAEIGTRLTRPDYAFEVAYYRSPANWYVGPLLEWSPSDYFIDHRNSFEADDYTIWGVKLGQQNDSGWSWFVEGRNLGDRKYAATTGIIEDAAGVDRAQFLPGDGRSFYAGLEWRAAARE